MGYTATPAGYRQQQDMRKKLDGEIKLGADSGLTLRTSAVRKPPLKFEVHIGQKLDTNRLTNDKIRRVALNDA